ncbi:hypothetical protein [Roseospira navarrensis]|uniref:Uncharacterized protein n=1 Tax=Roseospira navarrensis TaxID=140058 RepID=A0A7X1ZIK1_9PROT|nr:hypothetical protein [Roseospira navarrensis]MQX38614.1 hypothetical protein [Roseospira navarrensis]
MALAALDLEVLRGFISVENRKGRLSSVQRYLGNRLMRDALGVELNDKGELTSDVPEEEFDIMFREFMARIASKSWNTRDDAKKIGSRSNELRALVGVSGARIERVPLSTPPKQDESIKPVPKSPKKPTKIIPNSALSEALQEIPSYKLEKNILFSMLHILEYAYAFTYSGDVVLSGESDSFDREKYKHRFLLLSQLSKVGAHGAWRIKGNQRTP